MEIIVIAAILLLAVGAVAFPLLGGGRSPHDAREYATTPLGAIRETPPPVPDPNVLAAPADAVGAGDQAPAGEAGTDVALEREIAQYRTAIAAGTLCRKCGSPNEAGSRFCLECGDKLPLEDEREFAA